MPTLTSRPKRRKLWTPKPCCLCEGNFAEVMDMIQAGLKLGGKFEYLKKLVHLCKDHGGPLEDFVLAKSCPWCFKHETCLETWSPGYKVLCVKAFLKNYKRDRYGWRIQGET